MLTKQAIRKQFDNPYFPLSDSAIQSELENNHESWDCCWREFDSFASAYLNLSWVFGVWNRPSEIEESVAKAWFSGLTATIEFADGVLVNTSF